MPLRSRVLSIWFFSPKGRSQNGPSDARWLLTRVANNVVNDMVERGTSDVTLFKTADPLDLNCFGLDIRGDNEAFRGPDWNNDLLLY